jgi:hypothetical protein
VVPRTENDAWFERWTPRGVFLISLLAFLALRGSSLLDPPYWDALLGAFSQAIWSADHGLSPRLLLREGGAFGRGGVAVYPFSIYPWSLALLWALHVPREVAFLAFHLVSFASAALVLASVHALARPLLGARSAAWFVIALGCWPPFQSLACQMNMEMPIAACGTAAVRALIEGRQAASWLWTLVALLVKPTGAILVGAQMATSVLALLAPRAFGFGPFARRRYAAALAAHALLAALFLAQLRVLRAGKAHQALDWFSGFAPLLTSSIWHVPEFGLATLLALPLLVVAAARSRRVGLLAVETASASFLVTFIAFFGHFTNVLPRYCLQAAPFLGLFLGAASSWSQGFKRRLHWTLAAFALYGVVNSHGILYPARMAETPDPTDGQPYVASNGHFLERSLEYRADVELARRVARVLDSFDRDLTVFVAHWPFEQLLGEPRLGYVDRPFRTSSAEIPHRGHRVARRPVPYDTLYRRVNDRVEKRVSEDILWIVSPNVFAGEDSRYRPELDEVVGRFESGRLRAFLLRRRGWD